MKIGFAGSSLNNKERISGSAVPLVGFMSELNKEHDVYWIKKDPKPDLQQYCPVPIAGYSETNFNLLPRELELDLLVIQVWAGRIQETAKAFKEYGTKVVLWDDNTPCANERWIESVDYIDLILSHGDGAREILRDRIKNIRIENFYFATDPSRFKPEEDPNFYADVSFVGANLEERTEQLKYIFFNQANKFPGRKFKLYGSQWEEWAELKNYGVQYMGWVDNDDLNKVFYNSFVSVNATRELLRDIKLIPSNRIFDVMSSGGVLVSDPLPGIEKLFRVGHEMFIVENSDDCFRVMKRLFDNCNLRTDISREAREAILKAHTWNHRKDQLLSYV